MQSIKNIDDADLKENDIIMRKCIVDRITDTSEM